MALDLRRPPRFSVVVGPPSSDPARAGCPSCRSSTSRGRRPPLHDIGHRAQARARAQHRLDRLRRPADRRDRPPSAFTGAVFSPLCSSSTPAQRVVRRRCAGRSDSAFLVRRGGVDLGRQRRAGMGHGLPWSAWRYALPASGVLHSYRPENRLNSLRKPPRASFTSTIGAWRRRGLGPPPRIGSRSFSITFDLVWLGVSGGSRAASLARASSNARARSRGRPPPCPPRGASGATLRLGRASEKVTSETLPRPPPPTGSLRPGLSSRRPEVRYPIDSPSIAPASISAAASPPRGPPPRGALSP